MKKLLLSFALLLSKYSYGQLEAGVNFGLQPWRRTFETETIDYDIHHMWGIMAAYNFHFLRVGFQYSWSQYTTVGTYNTALDHRYYFADPMRSYTAQLAYLHQPNCKSDAYAGISGSLLRFNGQFDINPPFNGVTHTGKGVGYGIFIGGNYLVYKGLAVNVELAANRAHTEVTTENVTVDEDYWYFPITAGIHYQLFRNN